MSNACQRSVFLIIRMVGDNYFVLGSDAFPCVRPNDVATAQSSIDAAESWAIKHGVSLTDYRTFNDDPDSGYEFAVVMATASHLPLPESLGGRWLTVTEIGQLANRFTKKVFRSTLRQPVGV